MIRKKLIEVALPLEAINIASVREGYIYKGNPSAIHKWWAQRPLAACRAILFAQLVDDPSGWPNQFPTDARQQQERRRLFLIIERLVVWENSNNEEVINAARLEIARSFARARKADGTGDARDIAVLVEKPQVADVNLYLREVVPPLHDPFAGGGSIPLEAQRLGLRPVASDLNPVAVLINKGLIEIPPKFAGMPPINPESDRNAKLRSWTGPEGLAEDVRYYGEWMCDEMKKRIGHLYPEVKLPKEYGRGTAAPPIAWLWARTVASPNPACNGTHVPLVSSFWLSKRAGKEDWVEVIVDRRNQEWHFEVHHGKPGDPKAVDAGTKIGRGSFRCVMSGDPIPSDFLHAEGRNGRMSARLMAVVAERGRERLFVAPTEEQERIARVPLPAWTPDLEFAKNSRHMTPCVHGLDTFSKLFTARQLTCLSTLSALVGEVYRRILSDGGGGIRDGYAAAIGLYLTLAVSKMVDYHCNLVTWYAGEARTSHLFTRQALPMVWDFTENNPLGHVGGSFANNVEVISKAIQSLFTTSQGPPGIVQQLDAVAAIGSIAGQPLVSTDPPYYGNVPYADLSDIFYIWIRQCVKDLPGRLAPTLLTPKGEELIADPFRHGGADAAEEHFRTGMRSVLARLRVNSRPDAPLTIYYAFKQAEVDDAAVASTGWETFLQGVLDEGFEVTATWPVRTERNARTRGQGSNALATSVILCCRSRPESAAAITRADFRRLLRQDLPSALKALQHGNIAPVDMAQASIGPGMAIYSRHSKVLEADGAAMSVRTALQLINQALDEYLAEQEGEFDADTRFAVTWFETRGFDAGPFGEAETLAKARNVAVAGVAEAGVLTSAGGKVRLIKREDLPDDWDPATDKRLSIWEAAQHLIKRLDQKGEQGAAELLAKLGSQAGAARDLAYRLYTTCERKGWAEEARAYNGLVIAWPELEKLAGERGRPAPVQGQLL